MHRCCDTRFDFLAVANVYDALMLVSLIFLDVRANCLRYIYINSSFTGRVGITVVDSGRVILLLLLIRSLFIYSLVFRCLDILCCWILYLIFCLF